MELKDDTPVPEFVPTFDDLALLVLQGELKAFPLQALVVERDFIAQPPSMKDVTRRSGEVVPDQKHVEYYGDRICSKVVLTYQGLICLGKALVKEAGNKRYYRHLGYSSRSIRSSEHTYSRVERFLDVLEVVNPSAVTEFLKIYDDEMNLADTQAEETVKRLGWVKWTPDADERSGGPEAPTVT